MEDDPLFGHPIEDYSNYEEVDKKIDKMQITFILDLVSEDEEGMGRLNEMIGLELYNHFFKVHPHKLDIPLVNVSINSFKPIAQTYFEIVDLSRKVKKQLIKDLQVILPQVEDFEVRKINDQDQLLLGIANQDELMPISIFGESVQRATQIMLEISKWKSKRLMIDEIDTGIHHSRMKDFLKTIFKVALKNDVQLFMTTHSLECQEAFRDVFEDPEMLAHQKDARNYTLIDAVDGRTVANPYNFEQLDEALNTGFDTRGGKRGW